MPVAENKSTLTADRNFEVKESIALNLLIIIVLCPFLFYEIYIQLNHNIKHSQNVANFICFIIFLLVIIGAMLKLLNRKPIILVNKQGIYLHNKLITTWKNFVDAKYQEVMRLNHNTFILLVYYYKDDGEYYVMETPLRNTQNKAEEEVVDAIKYFYNLSQNSSR